MRFLAYAHNGKTKGQRPLGDKSRLKDQAAFQEPAKTFQIYGDVR